jgi:hypothetical protein
MTPAPVVQSEAVTADNQGVSRRLRLLLVLLLIGAILAALVVVWFLNFVGSQN